MKAPTTLYVVGNGFDLHHGVPSKFKDFGRYLQNASPYAYREIETFLGIDNDFWAEFEQRLAYLDTDAVLDYAGQFLASYSADDWSDSGHHDYEYELRRIVDAISITMLNCFKDWVCHLPIPKAGNASVRLLPLDRAAQYLTFNYTPTLQSAYGIQDSQILHIHGRAGAGNELILGHGWTRKPSDSLNFGIDKAEADVRIIDGNRIIDEYFSSTFKPTAAVLEHNRAFFHQLQTLSEVLILGHSLFDIDAPYFEEIIRNIDASRVKWRVSYYDDRDRIGERFSRFGIDDKLVSYLPLDAIEQWARSA